MSNAIEYYSGVAKQFHASYANDANRKERLQTWREVLDQYCTPVAHAYELGCGSGMITAEVASRVGSVVAIDGAQAMLDIAAQHAASRHLHNIEFMCASLPDESIGRPASADVVIASSALEYFVELAATLRWVRSILKPSGVLMFSMSNAESLSRTLVRSVHRVTGRPAYMKFLRHFVTPAGVARILKDSGLQLVAHRYCANRDRTNRVLSMFVQEHRASNMILFVARRAD